MRIETISSHSSSSNDESILLEAKKINSDLGRHVKKCSFSTYLTGRFYQNNSMDLQKAKEQRILRMKEVHNQLKKSLKLEDEKIRFLEQKLQEKEQKRREELEKRKKEERAASSLQSCVRISLARNRVKLIRMENKYMNYIALFLQSRFRGKTGRMRASDLKQKFIQHRKEELASIRIQTMVRSLVARSEFHHRQQKKMQELYSAACKIQAQTRGRSCRIKLQIAIKTIQDNAAKLIQSQYRGLLGRRSRDSKRRESRKKKRPGSSISSRSKDERIPLHERRYSTYSIKSMNKENRVSQRRFSEITSRSQSLMDRRSSLSGLEIIRKAEGGSKTKDSDVSQQIETGSDCSSMDQDSADKSELARQRAAARVAKLGRQLKKEKEEKFKTANSIKADLKKLEMKRKELLRVQKLKKENMKTSIKENNNAGKENSGHGIDNTTCGDDDIKSLDTAKKEIIESNPPKNILANGEDKLSVTEVNKKENMVQNLIAMNLTQLHVFDSTSFDDFNENEDDLSC